MAKRRLALEQLETRLCMAAPTLQATVNLPTTGAWTPTPYRASPIMVDIFGTGKDNLITVTAGSKLVAYGVQADGSIAPVVTYQAPNAIADIKSTPVVVTDPRTGRKALFAGMGRDERFDRTIEDGRVFGWDLQTGQLLPGWTQGVSTGINVAGITGIYGPITSGDLDLDGSPELVVTSFSHNVTAFRLDGSTMWKWTNDDTIVSGAVIGDIDRTGVPSVVVGGDSSESPFFRNGGWVTVLSNTGTLKWRKQLPGETTWSTPTLADLNNNGYLDIVIGTGLNFDFTGVPGSRALGNYIYALDPYGNILPGWPYHTTSDDSQPRQVLNSLAVADIQGDGQLDVVAIDRSGFLHVIAPNGRALPGFEGGKKIAPNFAIGALPDDYASPIIADVTGSGRAQIITSSGPFLRAFDANGNITVLATTNNVNGLPQGIDSAPVVGNMYGGANGTLALVTFDATNENRPSQALIFRLDTTSVAAPWPSLRRTVTGDGVVRSSFFDRNFVAQAFQGAAGSLPDDATTQPFIRALDANTRDLRATATAIFTSPLARQTSVQRVYQALLGHAANADGVTAWSNLLATQPIRNMQLLLASGPEFAGLAGNTRSGIVARMYQTLLNRTASQGEVDAWVATGLAPIDIANLFINSAEGVNLTLDTMYGRIFGSGTQNAIAADTRASFAYEFHRGAREEDLAAALLTNNGNQAASSFPARYTRELYRDILEREASPEEVAIWVQAYDSYSINLGQQVGFFLNSVEAKRLVVRQQFRTLLGRDADPGALDGLSNYANRESLILTIVGSPEYIARNGGTIPSYISAVYRDLAAFSPTPPDAINAWTNQFNQGAPLIRLAQTLIYNSTLYFNQTAVVQIMRYLPDQTLGVLRSADLPPTAAGQPINPSPALINLLVAYYTAGLSDEQVIGVLLTSSDYVNRSTYHKGIFRSLGVRI